MGSKVSQGIYMAHSAAAATTHYNYDIIKKFALMALVWGCSVCLRVPTSRQNWHSRS